MHLEGNVVVQVWEGNAVLCAHRLSDDDFVDVIELIPVLIPESQNTSHFCSKSVAGYTKSTTTTTKKALKISMAQE